MRLEEYSQDFRDFRDKKAQANQTSQASSGNSFGNATSGFIQTQPCVCPTCHRCPTCGKGGYYTQPYPYTYWINGQQITYTNGPQGQLFNTDTGTATHL